MPYNVAMKRWYSLITFLVLAIVLYFAGMVRESAVLLSLGILIEGAFWITLFRREDKTRN